MAFLIQKNINFNAMPQITVNSVNIENFGFSAVFNPYGQSIVFDTSELTTYNNESGTGFLYVLGICFQIQDQDGVVLASVDWDNPAIEPALGGTEYTLDLSSVGIDFFFQTYSIIGYIKDADGTVYQTTQVNPKICQPVGINSGGYVDGVFQITANCPDNILTVKEVTKLVYNNTEPDATVKEGVLTYPTGTISPVNFTGTPFTNDVIWTGQYRINCETVSTYSLGNDIYVAVTYLTDNVFDITCSNKVQDILCCIVDLQRTQQQNCNTAIGERAAQLEAQITIPFLVAISKEISGQDASSEVAYIKKTLNCKCGGKSIIQNEFTPINPSVTNIVLQGVGGTSIAAPTINGNTKTYNIQSNVYQVVKANSLDTAFSITLNTATTNTVKYVISFNYEILASTILTEIGSDSGLLTQFNSLVDVSNFYVDLTNLNGGCIIDLSSTNYFLSLKVPSASSTIVSILINGTTYTAPSPIIVNNPDSIEGWLNGLGLGTFNASYSTGTTGSYVNLLTTGNANVVTSAVFNIGTLITVLFQKTNKSIVAFLQALVDYICALSDVQVFLSTSLTLNYIDYNGQTVSQTLPADTSTQAEYNYALSQVMYLVSLNAVRTFNNALDPQTGGLVQWGGTLVKNTTIDQNGKTIQFIGDANSNILLGNNYFQTEYKAGSSSGDAVNVIYNAFEAFKVNLATNADRAAQAFYAKAYIGNENNVGIGQRSVIGTHYPVSINSSILPPAADPDKTAFVSANYDEVGGVGYVYSYGKTQTHIGSSSNFDTLLRVKVMTTAQRNAIDVSLLTAGIIIFNSTTVKFQGYTGVGWSDLN